MKKIKRWRYYCDYCKKSGGSGGHMKNHEKSCTKNPDRECGFCEVAGFLNNKEKLKAIVKKGISDFYFLDFDVQSEKFEDVQEKISEDLIDESQGCPACALAAVRQTEDSELVQFDYKKYKDLFWNEHNKEPDYSDYY